MSKNQKAGTHTPGPMTLIAKYRPCEEAVAWLGDRTLADAWSACDRGDWMLWLAARVDVDRKIVVRAACRCARLALHLVPADEDRPRKAIETAEAWCAGRATLKDVRAAAAASSSYSYAASAAASAAAYAASAAAYAASAAAYAADDADDAAEAVYAVCAAIAARSKTLSECADIVRSLIAFETIDAALTRATGGDE